MIHLYGYISCSEKGHFYYHEVKPQRYNGHWVSPKREYLLTKRHIPKEFESMTWKDEPRKIHIEVTNYMIEEDE